MQVKNTERKYERERRMRRREGEKSLESDMKKEKPGRGRD
jgi:hypothetical protein